MGNDKLMEEIVVPGGDKNSGATIPAEMVLDSTTADDWKVAHTGLMQKLEDRSTRKSIFQLQSNPPLGRRRALPLHIRQHQHSGKSELWS